MFPLVGEIDGMTGMGAGGKFESNLAPKTSTSAFLDYSLR